MMSGHSIVVYSHLNMFAMVLSCPWLVYTLSDLLILYVILVTHAKPTNVVCCKTLLKSYQSVSPHAAT